MSCGSWWSRSCPRAPVVGGGRGVITVRCSKRSPGGFALVVRGGTCRRRSGRGRRCRSGIAAGQPMAPTNWSSSACCNDKIRPDSWTGCCRSTRPSFVPISTQPARPHTAQGARSNDKIPEPDDHGLGRSRGGLTTKVHALIDNGVHPVVVQLSPGQAGDNPRLVPLLDALADIGHRPAHLLADKTSHALNLSSGGRRGHRSGLFGRGEGGVFVVERSGGQAVVQDADHAVEQVALGGGVAVAGGLASVVVGAGAG